MIGLLSVICASAPKCVTADTLRIRSGPGTGYPIVGRLEKGNGVDVIATSNAFSELADGTYVHSSYLGECETTTMYTTTKLNVRKAPIDGEVINSLAAGTQVTCYGTSAGGWFVIGSGKFVSASYLVSKKPEKYENPTKVGITLKKVFNSEGKCQNWKSDSGNYLSGSLGYTCAGITPGVGYQNHDKYFSYAHSCESSHSSAMFVKCAWDLNTTAFMESAGKLYTDKYFRPGGCASFEQPLHFICSDIAVNSGIGRSRQYLKELGAVGSDIKGYAHKMNELHRQDYIKWSMPGTANNKFRKGWLARAEMRDAFIDSY